MAITIGPYTIQRGEILPMDRESQTDQSVEEAEDGAVYVVEKDFDVMFLKASIKDSLNTVESLVYFLRNGVRYSAVPFFITDGFGRSWNVRYWGGKNIKWTMVGANLFSMSLVFRVEVA